jgi:tetratricopeptide (TPR) repeat protein
LNAAIAHWKLGDLDRAWDGFEKTVALKSDWDPALRGLAGIAVERNALSQALELHSKLIAMGERTSELLYNTGLLLQKSGQDEKAVPLYEEALVCSPDFPEALLNLGIALQALGREPEARVHWRKAIEANPELAHGYFQ